MLRVDVVIDTDPGIDDAIALLLALRSPELDVRGITVVHGNVPVEVGFRNAHRVLDLAGRREIPVSQGAAGPLLRPATTAEAVHGTHGLGDLDPWEEPLEPHELFGPAFLVRLLEETEEPLTVITLGPLTNVAIALLSAPHAAPRIERVVAMGGAYRVEGNVTPSAEFNVYADPEAAEVVLRSGVPITLVGLDVTMQCIVPGTVGERLRSSSEPVERFVGELIGYISKVYVRYYGIDGCAMHDPLAVAVAVDPSLVRTQALHVEVETGSGLTAGRTVADIWGVQQPPGEPNAEVAMEVDAPRFDELLWHRLLDRYPP
jgi:purine nucleosidase